MLTSFEKVSYRADINPADRSVDSLINQEQKINQKLFLSKCYFCWFQQVTNKHLKKQIKILKLFFARVRKWIRRDKAAGSVTSQKRATVKTRINNF